MALQQVHFLPPTNAELDIISRLLPRYYRLESGVSVESLPRNIQDKILPLSWLEGVAAMPGYLKYDERIGVSMCASSELAVRALDLSKRNVETSIHVLDLCCCPGMKFNSIVDKLLATDVVVGVDISPRRMQLCKSIVSKQIMQRANSPQCRLVCGDGTFFDGQYRGSQLIFDSDVVKEDMILMKANGRKRRCKSSREREKKRLREIVEQQKSSISTGDVVGIYDRVLVDAECTHDGSYRRVAAMGTKTKAAEVYYNPDRDGNVIELQKRLISNGFSLLKPGGILVYSTCSFKKEQNEDILQWFFEQNAEVAIPLSPLPDGCILEMSDSITEAENTAIRDHASRFIEGDDQSVKDIVDMCRQNEAFLEELSSEVCRYISSSPTANNNMVMKMRSMESSTNDTGRRLNNAIRLGRHTGTSGLFISRLSKKII